MFFFMFFTFVINIFIIFTIIRMSSKKLNIDKFRGFVNSLRGVNRHYLEDLKNKKVSIQDYYTDLLNNNSIANNLNASFTQLIIGRQGTGKTTLFHKSIDDLKKNKNIITIYLDAKEFSVNTNNETLIEVESKEDNDRIRDKEIQEEELFKRFIELVIKELADVFYSKYKKRILLRPITYFWHKRKKNELSSIENDFILKSRKEISILREIYKEKELAEAKLDKNKVVAKVKDSISVGVENEGVSRYWKGETRDDVLKVYLNLEDNLKDTFKKIKKKFKIEYIYIYLDDFSELSINNQQKISSFFIKPLVSDADNFIKYKIAVYNGKYSLKDIDNKYLNKVYLDFYRVYRDVDKSMMDLAIDFNKRLIKRRIKHYFSKDSDFYSYFELERDKLHELFFKISFNNPRKLGNILDRCKDKALNYGNKITKDTILSSTKDEYLERTKDNRIKNNEKSHQWIDIDLQKYFFDKVVEELKEKQGEVIKGIDKEENKGFKKTYSHFYINVDYKNRFRGLEHLGLITSFMDGGKNKTDRFFVLDYGYCLANEIEFEMPDNNINIEFYSNNSFNMTELFERYLENMIIYRCENGHDFLQKDEIDKIKENNYYCTTCLQDELSVKCEKIETEKLYTSLVDKSKTINKIKRKNNKKTTNEKVKNIVNFEEE